MLAVPHSGRRKYWNRMVLVNMFLRIDSLAYRVAATSRVPTCMVFSDALLALVLPAVRVRSTTPRRTLLLKSRGARRNCSTIWRNLQNTFRFVKESQAPRPFVLSDLFARYPGCAFDFLATDIQMLLAATHSWIYSFSMNWQSLRIFFGFVFAQQRYFASFLFFLHSSATFSCTRRLLVHVYIHALYALIHRKQRWCSLVWRSQPIASI